MITVDSAIVRFRRDLTVGAMIKGILLILMVLSLLMSLFPASPLRGIDGTYVLAVVGFIWLWLSIQSARGTRLARESPMLIASGNFAEAEAQIERAMRSFSLFSTTKLLCLHHLALLRHAQRRWQDSAILSRTLLRQRLGAMESLAAGSRLILADALLEMGDLRGAYEAIMGLYGRRLTLSEAMNLLLVQLDYCSRIGAWSHMMNGVMEKVQIAEVMPSNQNSAKVQALLALAAARAGRTDWAAWLSARVQLLTDVEQLCKERPVLREVLSLAASQTN